MMSPMPLADQMERRRKEQGHKSAGKIVPAPVWKKYRVLGFVNDGIHRVHQQAKDECQGRQTPAAMHTSCHAKTPRQGSELSQNDCEIKAYGDLQRHRRRLAANGRL